MGEGRAWVLALWPWEIEFRAGGGKGQEVVCPAPWGVVTWSPGKKGSISYHKTEIDIQVFIQEPGAHPILNVPHKKTMTLARLKHKARSSRWSRTAALSDVS